MCICLCIYVNVCMYICIYVCIYVCVYIDIYTDIIFIRFAVQSISWLFILLCLTVIQFVDAEQQVEMFILNWHKRTFCPSVRTHSYICILDLRKEYKEAPFYSWNFATFKHFLVGFLKKLRNWKSHTSEKFDRSNL